MNRKTGRSLIVAAILSSAPAVYGIAVDDYSIAESSPTNAGYDLRLDYVYKYKGASAAAVDHYWILTAAHVADDSVGGNLVIDGTTYYQQEIVFHDEADLALVRYDKPLPGYYPLIDREVWHEEKSGWFGTTKVWHELILAGYGWDGEVYDDYFTQGSSRGILRWGTNRGTGESTKNVDVGGTAGDRSTSCVDMTFTLDDTDYEAGANVYDSGGPVFSTNNAGEWALAGVSLYRQNKLGSTTEFTGNSMAKVLDYVDWIKSVITNYDTDQDFLPDWWEKKYGGDETSMKPDDDDDGDGFSNLDEWLSDTDPTDAASHFAVLEWNAPSNVVFTSSSNRDYCVEYRTNLLDSAEDWKTDVDWRQGGDGQTSLDLGTGDADRIYRIRARLHWD